MMNTQEVDWSLPKAFFEEWKKWECNGLLEVCEREVKEYADLREKAASVSKKGTDAEEVFLTEDKTRVIKCKRGRETLLVELLMHNRIFGNPEYGNVRCYRKESDGSRGGGTIKAYAQGRTFGVPTPYSVLGWTSLDDRPVLVLSQPYIRFKKPLNECGLLAREMLSKDLCEAFGCTVSEPATIDRDWLIELETGLLHLDDLKNVNLGIEQETGRYAVVDCIVRGLEDKRNMDEIISQPCVSLGETEEKYWREFRRNEQSL